MKQKKRLIRTLLNLVKINSEAGNEKDIASYVLNKCKRLRLEVKKDRAGNVIVVKKGDGDPILLVAHLDSVASKNVKAVIANGAMKGSGNTILGGDDKVGIALILEILESLNEIRSDIPLEAIFTAGSGNIFQGAKNLSFRKIKSKQGILLDGEGDVGCFTSSSPTYLNLEYKLSGVSYHTTCLGNRANLLKAVSSVLSALPIGKISARTISNLVIFDQGSTRRNITPGYIIVNGEIRSFDRKELLRYGKTFSKKFKDLAKNKGFGLRENNFVKFNGYQINDKIFLNRLKDACRKAGTRFQYKSTWRGSDANIFNEKGVTLVEMGIGIKNANTSKEAIPLTSMEKAYNLLLHLLEAKRK